MIRTLPSFDPKRIHRQNITTIILLIASGFLTIGLCVLFCTLMRYGAYVGYAFCNALFTSLFLSFVLFAIEAIFIPNRRQVAFEKRLASANDDIIEGILGKIGPKETCEGQSCLRLDIKTPQGNERLLFLPIAFKAVDVGVAYRFKLHDNLIVALEERV